MKSSYVTSDIGAPAARVLPWQVWQSARITVSTSQNVLPVAAGGVAGLPAEAGVAGAPARALDCMSVGTAGVCRTGGGVAGAAVPAAGGGVAGTLAGSPPRCESLIGALASLQAPNSA